MTAPLFLSLPFPPSVNTLFPGTVRRFKSKRYKAWLAEAGKSLYTQPTRQFTGPVSVRVELGRPDKRVRDLDNYFKAVLDLLVSHDIIEDDCMIHRLEAYWAEIEGAKVEIHSI
jgi:crossover junction endodeoxyribonuclease RusA